MPLPAQYDKQHRQPCRRHEEHRRPRYGGSITAALFIQRFVNDTPWAHLDIAVDRLEAELDRRRPSRAAPPASACGCSTGWWPTTTRAEPADGRRALRGLVLPPGAHQRWTRRCPSCWRRPWRAAGGRWCATARARARIEHLDGWLWTYRDDSFLPHGADDEPMAERQPILLTHRHRATRTAPTRCSWSTAPSPASSRAMSAASCCSTAATRRRWPRRAGVVGVQGRGGGRILLAAGGDRGMAQGSLRWLAAVAALALVAGGARSRTSRRPRRRRRRQAAPAPAPVVAPPQSLGSRDTCRADPLQYLVGHPRTDIPVPVNPNLRRVVCSTCAMTKDYDPSRQTIVYDCNGLVHSVKCGEATRCTPRVIPAGAQWRAACAGLKRPESRLRRALRDAT